jgi:serine protease inhibitor
MEDTAMNRVPQVIMLIVVLAMLLSAGCGPVAISLPFPAPDSSVAESDKPRNLSPAASAEDLTELADGNAALAFDLYRTLREKDGNLFFSPYSISTALAMTYAGASGETASQMAATLHFTLPAESLHPAFNAYALDLQARAEQATEGTPFELSIANSLWGQQGFPFLQRFLDLLAVNYGAGMRLVDYESDPEGARKAINDWVSDETREKIKDLIPQGAIDAMTRLVLANAIYFKAGWLNPFEEIATSPESFHLLEGSTVEVPMMHQSKSYGYVRGDGYQAIELPYQNSNTSMLIILPDEGQFKAVEGQLNPAMMTDVLSRMTYGPVNLGLPKFTYESAFNLNQALTDLGMTDAFDPGRADFSGMDGARDLYISQVLHKAFVSVDEKGTEAAAATAVIMELTSAPMDEPFTFTVDRPFIYMIRDQQSGTILFLGRVMDPSA